MKKLLLFLLSSSFSIFSYTQALEIDIENYTAVPAESFCLDFPVDSFNQIVSAQYTLTWDPMVMSYDTLANLGLPHPQNFFYNTAFVDQGQLLINWFDSQGNGNDLPDGTVMYEVCFVAEGPVGSMTMIAFSDLPLQIEVTSANTGGTNLGVDFSGGKVTIVEPLILDGLSLSQPDCNNPDVGSIEAIMTGGVEPHSFAWTGPDNFMANTAEINNLSSGWYFLTVSDASDPPIFYIDSFEISNSVNVPDVVIADPSMITCVQSEVTLDASASSQGTMFVYEWSTIDGNIVDDSNIEMPVVDQAGTYELLITNSQNGCTSIETVLVEENTIEPTADAGADVPLDCANIVVVLDGNNSSNGTDYITQWSSTDGNIMTGGSTLTPTVNESGTYQLIITNTLNGCTSLDEVIVLLDEDLEVADAGIDETLCESFYDLNANLPENNSGLWINPAGVEIDDPGSNISSVSLNEGINELIWILSTVDCPEYSVDTVTLVVESSPEAASDNFQIPFGENPSTLDLTSNDEVPIGAFDLEILSNPEVGDIEVLDEGSVELSYPSSFFGELEFEYILCSQVCPNLCDTAIVVLRIEDQIRIDTTVETPNAITPNGDGINDQFIIPVLENNPEDFPNNEMVIFNRWGDQVFRAAPYQNNWGGKHKGKVLPQGTYYYILKLDVANKQLIKGEVTILK